MFICSANPKLNLTQFDRLHAYPATPDLSGDKLIILDSGAYGLSKSGKKMDAAYIDTLAQHYRQYTTRDKVYCIAPDVFKSPALSIKQYNDFRQKYADVAIAPVLQFKTSQPDLFDTKKQIDIYAKSCNSNMICISNNKFNPIKQYDELSYIVHKVRQKFKNHWIHVLGAGYNHNNVKDWLKLGVDSMDSVSYYTDAQSKMQWIQDSYQTEPSALSFAEIAIYNATLANS